MKNMMDWIKGHWVILAMMGFAVIALPVMLYFSSSMSASAKTKVEGELKTDWNDLTIGAKTTYTAAPLLPGDPPVEKTNPAPNPRFTEWFKKHMDEQAAMAAEVVQQAVTFNQGTHGFLVPGLLPNPDAQRAVILRKDMARAFLIEAHPALFTAMGAGGPPDAAALAADLQAFQLDLLKAKTGKDKPDMNTLGQAEKDDIAKQVLGKRVGAYQRQADRVSVYADVNCMHLPSYKEDPPPSMIECWVWQNEFWIHEDILAAVKLVNQGEKVPGAVVKRIDSIHVDPFPGLSLRDGMGGFNEPRPGEVTTPPPAAGNPGEAPVDYHRSATGRFSGPGSNNGLYDVRNATVTVIASTKNLPRFFDALARVNFMTVIDVDIDKIDPVAEMNAGYYYGDEHVSRVTLTIETIWLRAWTARHMPKEVRSALGIPDPVEPAPPAPSTPPRG